MTSRLSAQIFFHNDILIGYKLRDNDDIISDIDAKSNHKCRNSFYDDSSRLTGWGSNSIVNAITSSVNPAEIKAENAKLRKTEGTKAVTKEGGIQLGDKTIS